MPVSKKRTSGAPAVRGSVAVPQAKKKGPSPVWLPALMLALFLIGILWLVVFYLTSESGMPLVGGLGNGNLLIGFAFIVLGFIVSTQWR